MIRRSSLTLFTDLQPVSQLILQLVMHSILLMVTSNESSDLGIWDFMQMIDNNYPEWCVVIVEAPVETLANTVASPFHATSWKKDIPIYITELDGEDVADWKAVVQDQKSKWSVIYKDIFEFNGSILDWGIKVSQELNSSLITFSGEETGGDISYQLIQAGEMIEEYLYSGKSRFDFYSKLRSKPELDLLDEKENEKTYADGYTHNLRQHLSFINKTFSDQAIYLPACYPQRHQGNFRLAVSESSSSKISRADLVNID